MREPGQIKRAPRVETSIPATLVGADGQEVAVVVTDISREGFRLSSHETIAIGEYVRLRVAPSGDHSAQIRWSLDGQAGGVFLDPSAID